MPPKPYTERYSRLPTWLQLGPRPCETSGEPTLTAPVSQVCTEAQFSEPAYAYWCEQFRETPRMHRKQWEFCYVLQALSTRGRVAPGRRGLGFGVGEEPLAALFASRGVQVTATDLDPQRAADVGWNKTGQHAKVLADLNQRAICPPDAFDKLVSLQTVDMNAIPSSLSGYDFV